MSDCCSKAKIPVPCSITLEDLDGLICYCFEKSKRELLSAIEDKREETFLEYIKAKMKDPGCFCEKANPSGKCCLQDVKSFIEATKIDK